MLQCASVVRSDLDTLFMRFSNVKARPSTVECEFVFFGAHWRGHVLAGNVLQFCVYLTVLFDAAFHLRLVLDTIWQR